MDRKLKVCASAVAIVMATSIGLCWFKVERYERAFANTAPGQTIDEVVAEFGLPNVSETRALPFDRYATDPCAAPCSERLWWEHPFLAGIEAWSVTLDKNKRVIDKSHWVSP